LERLSRLLFLKVGKDLLLQLLLLGGNHSVNAFLLLIAVPFRFTATVDLPFLVGLSLHRTLFLYYLVFKVVHFFGLVLVLLPWSRWGELALHTLRLPLLLRGLCFVALAHHVREHLLEHWDVCGFHPFGELALEGYLESLQEGPPDDVKVFFLDTRLHVALAQLVQALADICHVLAACDGFVEG